MRRRTLTLSFIAALAVASIAPAGAQVPEIRLARQYSMGYLQLNVIEDRKLIEKHASALGLARLFAHCTAVERNVASMAPDALEQTVAELAALRLDSLAALDACLHAPEASAALV